MKLFLALALALFSSVSMACTDFSGSYRDSSSQPYYVTQSGCTSVTLSSPEGAMTIITDGQYRAEENDQVRVMTAASFVGETLTLISKIEYKFPFPADMPTESIPVKSETIVTLDSAGNLVQSIAIYNSNNQVLERTTQTHQKN